MAGGKTAGEKGKDISIALLFAAAFITFIIMVIFFPMAMEPEYKETRWVAVNATMPAEADLRECRDFRIINNYLECEIG